MPHYTIDDICNLALVGQSGAGKTTLVESLLFRGGVIGNPGSVENGNTVCDYDPLEKEYQHSLSVSMASLDHNKRHINLLDTPGYPDLMGHAISVFPAVETLGVVINAQAGIELVARRMLERATRRRLCRMIIINKMDVSDVNLSELVAGIREEFGSECLPLNLPAEGGQKVVDCFFNPDGESDFGPVLDAHNQIIDQVVEVDEELMTLYLEQGEALSPEQLHAPFEKALREGHLVPICFVSAKTGVGVPELLEVFTRLMPNPREGNPRPFYKGEGAEREPFRPLPDETLHAVAHVFKVSSDPYMGKLGLFRVHQGTVTKDSQLFVGDGRKPFKVGHLFKLQGKQQVEVDSAIPGDICAVAKVDALHFDAVLHDSHDEDHIHLKPLDFPAPMYGLAILGKQGEEQKLGTALQKLDMEDPCLTVEHDPGLNQTVLRGLGEFHLRIVLERMKQQFGLEVETRPPKIPYRETISLHAEGHYRHKKQTGGAGQFGEVYLRVDPLPRGAGFEFADEVVGGAIPNVYIPAVEKGVRQVLESGAIAGYRMQDVKVTVYDGKSHPVDSKEVAFVTAGKKAFLAAIAKAKPLVLEPLVNVEVSVPNEAVGTITGGLASKRARIQGNEIRSGSLTAVLALVPLSELGNYQTELKSTTGGSGFFSMEFSHYEAVPGNVQQQLMAEYKPKDSEE